jgi:hypothetical protein
MEYLLLVCEFFKTRKKTGIILPLMVGGTVFYFSDSCLFSENGTSIQENILNVAGILLGFTISFFAIFIGGNSESIEESKKYKTKYKLYNKEISLHTTIIIALGYITLIESVLLIISVLSPIFFKISSLAGRILFSISIFLLLHTIVLLLKVILEFYFIITKNR